MAVEGFGMGGKADETRAIEYLLRRQTFPRIHQTIPSTPKSLGAASKGGPKVHAAHRFCPPCRP